MAKQFAARLPSSGSIGEARGFALGRSGLSIRFSSHDGQKTPVFCSFGRKSDIVGLGGTSIVSDPEASVHRAQFWPPEPEREIGDRRPSRDS